MNNETYLNHPTFGLLYRVCLLDNSQELFTTLYAQRLFFLVKLASESITFDPVTRSDARLLVENRLRKLRRTESTQEYKDLYAVYKRTFM
jgi:PII interaction protein X